MRSPRQHREYEDRRRLPELDGNLRRRVAEHAGGPDLRGPADASRLHLAAVEPCFGPCATPRAPRLLPRDAAATAARWSGGRPDAGPSAPRAASTGCAQEAELLDLLDRFFALVDAATHRVGELFPYHHLCRRLQALLSRSPAHVTVTDEHGRPLVTGGVTWRDGRLQRTEAKCEAALAWAVPRQRLEHAAAEPWVYLADPRRLDFAWFNEPSAATTTTLGIGPARLT